MDLGLSIVRGIMQGVHRGFYMDYEFELSQGCFGKDALMMMYEIGKSWESLEFEYIWSSMGLWYNLYYLWDYHCTIEKTLYDLSAWCFEHDCGWEKLMKNEMSKVFQVTGSLNAIAAVYYDDQPVSDQHSGFFDMYNEVGVNIGKLWRYCFAFDAKELKYLELLKE